MRRLKNNTNIIRHIGTAGRRQKNINEYEDLFKNNHTIKDLTIDIQLKKDTKPVQQKGRPVPIHFRKTVKHELDKLIEKRHLEMADYIVLNDSKKRARSVSPEFKHYQFFEKKTNRML